MLLNFNLTRLGALGGCLGLLSVETTTLPPDARAACFRPKPLWIAQVVDTTGERACGGTRPNDKSLSYGRLQRNENGFSRPTCPTHQYRPSPPQNTGIKAWAPSVVFTFPISCQEQLQFERGPVLGLLSSCWPTQSHVVSPSPLATPCSRRRLRPAPSQPIATLTSTCRKSDCEA